MKVKQEDVNYLVFEGGGGKGITYLGVANALHELGILEYTNGKLNADKIKGIAGTSVGSLTATLLASGYNPSQVEAIITDNLTTKILDSVEFDKVPTIYTTSFPNHIYSFKEDNNKRQAENLIPELSDLEEKSLKEILRVPGKVVKNFNYHFFSHLFKWYIEYESKKDEKEEEEEEKLELLTNFEELARNKMLKPVINKVFDNAPEASNSLKFDFGMFIGGEFRKMLDNLIKNKTGIPNCTFKQFHQATKIDLVLTGFDVTKNEVLYFRNNEIFENLCVSDAVRMSISIPMIFKPVLMERRNTKIGSFSKRVGFPSYIVDGGIGNNFPMRVFNDKDDKLNPNVLGFELAVNYFTPSKKTMLGFMESIFLAMIKKTTEAQLRNDEEREQRIELDSKDLRVLDFSYEELPQGIIDNAKKKTLEYFE